MSDTRTSPVTDADQCAPRPHGAPEWLWYGESEDGKPVVTFGRWPKRGAKWRYKFAEIQPTEHDHGSTVTYTPSAPPDQTPLRDAVQYVLDKFKKDEAQGYHTKDRQFAIEILDKTLSGTSTVRADTENKGEI
jgi:hypothetical protein